MAIARADCLNYNRGMHSRPTSPRKRAFSLVVPQQSGVPAQSGILFQRGFSLVELSIVLVILGLLVGGVLSGQSLIKAAQLRAVSTEYAKYSTSVMTFRDKYLAIPGDMANATSFWGTAAACPGTVASTTPTTCNGDGDGRVYVCAAPYGCEAYRFWQQLANAGLIEGSYSGIDQSGVVFSGNVPASRFANGGWSSGYWDNSTNITDPNNFAKNMGNALLFGGNNTVYAATYPILKNEELWNIDTKMDDGKPGMGRIIGANVGCSTRSNATDFAAVYDLSNSSSSCSLIATAVY